MTHLESFLAEVRREFPRLRIVEKKDSSWMRGLNVLSRASSFGRRHDFMMVATTMGDTIFVSDFWKSMNDVDKIIVLRHELVHMRQIRLLGLVTYVLLYSFPLIPGLPSPWRHRFEREAFAETILATAQLRGMQVIATKLYKDSIIRSLTGPELFWSYRGSKQELGRWLDSIVGKTIRMVSRQQKLGRWIDAVIERLVNPKS